MTGAEPGADERRVRQLLRRGGVGPDALPPPPAPAAAARPSDWLDDIIGSPAAPDSAPEPEEQPVPWWRIRKDTPAAPAASPVVTVPVIGEQQGPGVHVTVVQAAPAPQPSARRARIRWWVLRRGTAAGLGWLLGLGPALQRFLTDAGPGAVGAACLFWVGAWLAATRLLRFVPREAIAEVHTAADWAAHIPSATVLLALALHTPGALQ